MEVYHTNNFKMRFKIMKNLKIKLRYKSNKKKILKVFCKIQKLLDNVSSITLLIAKPFC